MSEPIVKRKLMRVELPPGARALPTAPVPPGTGRPYWPIIVVAPGTERVLFSLSEQVLTYRCHYLGETYVPCLEDYGLDCACHGDGGPRTIWQGSIAGLDETGKRVCLTHFTRAAMTHSQIHERKDLAGRRIVVGRRNGGRNARMYCHVGAPTVRVPVDRLIDHEQLWEQLLYIWGVELVRAPELPKREEIAE